MEHDLTTSELEALSFPNMQLETLPRIAQIKRKRIDWVPVLEKMGRVFWTIVWTLDVLFILLLIYSFFDNGILLTKILVPPR